MHDLVRPVLRKCLFSPLSYHIQVQVIPKWVCFFCVFLCFGEKNLVSQAPPLPSYNGNLPSPSVLDEQVRGQAPTAPVLLYQTKDGQTFGLPVQSVQLTTEMHVATAFSRLKIIFQNTSNEKVCFLVKMFE